MAKHDKHFFIALALSLVLSTLIAAGAQGVVRHQAHAAQQASEA